MPLFRFSLFQQFLILAFGALGSTLTLASGYHLGLQSVRSIATANANAAEASEASTITTNPAGLSQLEGTQVNSHLFLAQPEIKYKKASGQFSDHSQVQGHQQGDLTPKWQLVPQWYGSHQLNDQWHVGLGVYIPYGARTSDHHQSVLRYNVNSTHVKSLDINPAVAYTLNDQHAIGFGLIAQYMEASLEKYADFTPIGAAISGIPSPILHDKKPGAFDVKAHVKGHDWGYGFNAGWLWNINDDVRLGVSYRSKISHKLKGHSSWQATGQAISAALPVLVQSGYLAKEGASVPLTTPEVWSIHGQWQVNPQWKVFAQTSWTRSDRLKNLDIQFEHDKVINPATGHTSDTARIATNWRNTYAVAVGTAYQYNDKLQWLGGIGYDQSPVRDNQSRLSTLPDGNRWIFGTGVQYQWDKRNTLNASYAYLHIQKTTMHQQDQGEHISSHVLGQGHYRANAHILGLSYNHRF